VFARTLINSTNGRGIVEHVVGDGPIPVAPLYTAYIPKKAEYRVHVFNGEVIDVQQKKQKSEFAGARNTRIRNLASGYVYCRDGIAPPDGCTDLAVRAVAACGYLYGAVDLIYNQKRDQCFVLEVNSRPGLTDSTCGFYADAIIKHYGLTRRAN
jgi:glutathione synthase/RimK-type ligase-like ATP-grasp enzyme